MGLLNFGHTKTKTLFSTLVWEWDKEVDGCKVTSWASKWTVTSWAGGGSGRLHRGQGSGRLARSGKEESRRAFKPCVNLRR